MNGLSVDRTAPASLVERTIAEAVDAYAVPKIRAAVLELAMRWARLDAVPERGEPLREFVDGALRRACEQMLGVETAETIRHDLEPLVVMLRSAEVTEIRPSTPPAGSDFPELTIEEDEPPEPTARTSGRRRWRATAPEPLELHRVLVATMDPASVSEMSRWMAGVALVEPVRDALEVLENIDQRDGLVVVDCRRPAVSVETLVALAPEMPKDARAVLWGERGDLEQHLARLGTAMPPEWVCCGPKATAEDVAAVVRILLE